MNFGGEKLDELVLGVKMFLDDTILDEFVFGMNAIWTKKCLDDTLLEEIATVELFWMEACSTVHFC